MVLYLCQHGDALAKDIDPDRPLSGRGTTDIRNTVNVLRGRVRVAAVVHSGKTRARQTAELLHEGLAPRSVIRAEPGLGPSDSVEDFAAGLASSGEGLLLVGHMPFVGRLASLLLGNRERNILSFQPGAVAALRRDEDGAWMLEWMLTPALVSEASLA
ncbi:MAG: phosphohistidine phosphatase SixA [Arenicellales bacterium]